MAAPDGSEFFDLEIDPVRESFARQSNAESTRDDEDELIWEAIGRLPSQKRDRFAVLRRSPSEAGLPQGHQLSEPVDVGKLDRAGRELVVKKALATNSQDNYKLLSAMKKRLDKVGLQVPNVEVRFDNLNIVANVQIGSRALPTLTNAARDTIEDIFKALRLYRPKRYSLTILNQVNGILKPGRMTLLLGPPGSGKSTLLKALAGKLDDNLKVTGDVTYNGQNLDKFYVQRTSAYISQTDNHIAELTVRETLDFAARWQGASEDFAGNMKHLVQLEKEKNIRPSADIDAFMKASSVRGKKHNISTDYILKVLGLDICADTVVGSDMLRGVSGGQKKRVTTGEMIVGPRKTLFMDEISTGLDSSTTYQIVKCIGNFVHLLEGTVLMALLQPPPETFDLFDDLILLSEGYVVYEGPREEVVKFFESLGFQLPPRKGVADFLQEVTSKKDQAQYWADPSRPYVFISAPEIARAFENSAFGRSLSSAIDIPYNKAKAHPEALAKTKYAAPRWELLKTCFAREMLLISRHRFLYIFKTCQVAFIGFVTCTIFNRSRLHPTSELEGNLYLSCLFFGLVHMLFNGFSELSLLMFRLPVFYKQRDNLFHPAWAWSLASFLLRVPYSILEAVVWSLIVYYSVGFSPEIWRFFRFMFLLFVVHQMALGLFRLVAAVARDMVVASTFASAALLITFLTGGFIIPKALIKSWWSWAFWLSPLTYAQRAVSVNEFTAARWMKKSAIGNDTIGYNILRSRSLPTDERWYWLGVGVLLVYALVFNILVTLALAFLHQLWVLCWLFTALKKAQAVTPLDAAEKNESNVQESKKKGMILPFQPLVMTFHNVNYFVDMPKGMHQQGVNETRLQLLSNVSGVFSPGVLTALVGSSGAGKTTLMDVLAGRKTGGYITGDIKISGHNKVQSTFARVSGYVEQFDIHSPQVTVEESLWFSSSLRLPKEVSKEQRREFVEEVMRLVELDTLRQALVGLPGSSGLSTEQRKRLTIAVELVANPSIIFMDEPTSGLDARAAAIVMRTVRNTVDTGRTVVCTIHQPSIDIFEAFDELLLMKRGGRVIYGGKLGLHSKTLVDYFQGIRGVSPIPEDYNPATWMLEVTTASVEETMEADFAELYATSQQYREVEASIMRLSEPPPGSAPIQFSTKFARDPLSQFLICLKKQSLVYWRSPRYNAVRLFYTTIAAIILGTQFWGIGSKRDTTQSLFTVMGAMYGSCIFLGVSNASTVQPIVSIERTVFYREKAAGMHSPLAYAAAQVEGIVEVPYIFAQTILYCFITYFMIGFDQNAGKFILYMVFMFLTFTYFTFWGMMAVGLTPNQNLAAVVSSAFYSLWNLLSGFLIPRQFIPVWWIWFYYICPIAWTLQGIISSQLGDVETMVQGQGFRLPVKDYLKKNYGYGTNKIGPSIAALLGFNVLFFSAYAYSVKMINFQRR
ncbi:ABC transporter G family member 31 [Linum perenne]